MKLLKDIAEIRSGFPFRKKPERVESGGCCLVQMRNVDRSLGEINGNLEMVKAPDNWKDQRLQSGDVLFTARGQTNGAGVFASNVSNAIAASTLLVLRPRDLVFPSYLAWYLNLPHTRERLQSMQAGSSIPFIPIDELGKLTIHLPPMELQRKIVDLVLLGQEEQVLMEMLRRKRLALIEGAIRTLLK
jgi:hypothetical protein